MKTFNRLCCFLALLFSALALQAQETNQPLAPATAQVLKLAQAGVGDDVLLAYVQGVKTPFQLTADTIIELKNAKVGSQVLTAMINHDRPAQSASPSTPAPAAPAPNPDPSALPSPLVEVVPLDPGPGYYWAPGFWSWEGSNWVWMHGVWAPRYGWYGWHRHWRHW